MENVAVYSNDYVVCAYASENTIHLKWRLRFEFVTSEPLINVVYGEVCKAPIDVPIETLAWNGYLCATLQPSKRSTYRFISCWKCFQGIMILFVHIKTNVKSA
ncbi:unnamed protein product [Cylicocyclus nassatus]|uniref:Uncharacterized protein n=1 Tax=Cylicocyclus nassatus TaxID=53992 RepID=A0AA36GWQ4_CYLNA|nr:unnamed protein product [Cylicocyclus nassatus]